MSKFNILIISFTLVLYLFTLTCTEAMEPSTSPEKNKDGQTPLSNAPARGNVITRPFFWVLDKVKGLVGLDGTARARARARTKREAMPGRVETVDSGHHHQHHKSPESSMVIERKKREIHFHHDPGRQLSLVIPARNHMPEAHHDDQSDQYEKEHGILQHIHGIKNGAQKVQEDAAKLKAFLTKKLKRKQRKQRLNPSLVVLVPVGSGSLVGHRRRGMNSRDHGSDESWESLERKAARKWRSRTRLANDEMDHTHDPNQWEAFEGQLVHRSGQAGSQKRRTSKRRGSRWRGRKGRRGSKQRNEGHIFDENWREERRRGMDRTTHFGDIWARDGFFMKFHGGADPSRTKSAEQNAEEELADKIREENGKHSEFSQQEHESSAGTWGPSTPQLEIPPQESQAPPVESSAHPEEAAVPQVLAPPSQADENPFMETPVAGSQTSEGSEHLAVEAASLESPPEDEMAHPDYTPYSTQPEHPEHPPHLEHPEHPPHPEHPEHQEHPTHTEHVAPEDHGSDQQVSEDQAKQKLPGIESLFLDGLASESSTGEHFHSDSEGAQISLANDHSQASENKDTESMVEQSAGLEDSALESAVQENTDLETVGTDSQHEGSAALAGSVSLESQALEGEGAGNHQTQENPSGESPTLEDLTPGTPSPDLQESDNPVLEKLEHENEALGTSTTAENAGQQTEGAEISIQENQGEVSLAEEAGEPSDDTAKAEDTVLEGEGHETQVQSGQVSQESGGSEIAVPEGTAAEIAEHSEVQGSENVALEDQAHENQFHESQSSAGQASHTSESFVSNSQAISHESSTSSGSSAAAEGAGLANNAQGDDEHKYKYVKTIVITKVLKDAPLSPGQHLASHDLHPHPWLNYLSNGGADHHKPKGTVMHSATTFI